MKFYTVIKAFNESSLYDDVDDEIRITNMKSYYNIEDAKQYQQSHTDHDIIVGQTISDHIIIKLYADLIRRQNAIATEDFED